MANRQSVKVATPVPPTIARADAPRAQPIPPAYDPRWVLMGLEGTVLAWACAWCRTLYGADIGSGPPKGGCGCPKGSHDRRQDNIGTVSLRRPGR